MLFCLLWAWVRFWVCRPARPRLRLLRLEAAVALKRQRLPRAALITTRALQYEASIVLKRRLPDHKHRVSARR